MLKNTILLLSIALFLFFAACNSANNGDSETVENKTAGGEAGKSSENANEDTSSAETSSLPKSQDLDLQANHPNGTVLRVTKVSYKEDSIVLDFSVTNGYKYEIKLAQGGMQLKDSAGNQYNLAPPQGNPDIEVAPGSTVKGNLTFLGRVSPDANSLTLTTNRRYNTHSNEYDTTPNMIIDKIPVEK